MSYSPVPSPLLVSLDMEEKTLCKIFINYFHLFWSLVPSCKGSNTSVHLGSSKKARTENINLAQLFFVFGPNLNTLPDLVDAMEQ